MLTIYRCLPVHTIYQNEEPRGATCYRCGEDHLATDCRFKDSECHFCKKKGHLANCKVCRSKVKAAKAKPGQGTSKQGRAKLTHKTHVLTEKHVDEAPVYSLFKLTNPHSKLLLATHQVNGADLEMEVNTEATVSVVSAETYRTLWPE